MCVCVSVCYIIMYILINNYIYIIIYFSLIHIRDTVSRIR